MKDDVCINPTGGTPSQGIHISNHYTVCFIYLTFVFVNDTSIKLRGEERICILK